MKNKPTKSIKLANLLLKANRYLASDAPTITRDMRLGMCGLIEIILHDTGNYSGWRLLKIEGKQYFDTVENKWIIFDDSRRFYYESATIKKMNPYDNKPV